VTAIATSAQTFTVLYNFTGGSDGGYPYAGLVQDATGNLYGTTTAGGAHLKGTVFRIEINGTETVLYSFTGGADGAYPYAELVQDTAGNLYGTTFEGGDLSCNAPYFTGCGTVFKVSKTGKESVLHTFTGTDGCNPDGGLLSDKAGNWYGTTKACGAVGGGAVYKLNKKGVLTLLHNFPSYQFDGLTPAAGVIMDAKGDLYGNTIDGGRSGKGTVFKIDTTGTESVLQAFTGGTTDGCYVYGTPTMGSESNLYGTASECGSFNMGIVWKVNLKGKETVLHNFAGGSSDGDLPFAGVIMDAKGNFYGTTNRGGASDVGTVYKLNKKGVVTLLHSFAGSDGEFPNGSVLMDAKGNLYGTSTNGGSGSYGTVWKITR